MLDGFFIMVHTNDRYALGRKASCICEYKKFGKNILRVFTPGSTKGNDVYRIFVGPQCLQGILFRHIAFLVLRKPCKSCICRQLLTRYKSYEHFMPFGIAAHFRSLCKNVVERKKKAQKKNN